MSSNVGIPAGMSFAWLGNRTWEAECLLPWFPIAFTVTLEDSELPAPGLSREQEVGARSLWGSDALTGAWLLDIAARRLPLLRQCDQLLSYVPFVRPLPGLPPPTWRIAPRLQTLWGHKAKTREWSSRAGIPTLPTLPLATLQRACPADVRLVLQEAGGSCGARTYIGAGAALRRKWESFDGADALVSLYRPGKVINGHVAVFSPSHIEVPWPSLQLVQHAPEGDLTLPLYAGNDYLAYQHLPPGIQGRVGSLLLRLGQCAAEEGYQGLLGADILFVPEDDSLALLEVNARMQGSTGLLSLLESRAGVLPTIVRLFLSQLGLAVPVAPRNIVLPQSPDAPSAQCIVRQGLGPCVQPKRNPLFMYGRTKSSSVKRYGVLERRVFAGEIVAAAMDEYKGKGGGDRAVDRPEAV